jgi:SM-20-related protein
MDFLDFSRLAETPLAIDPFEYVVVPRFVRDDALPAIRANFPAIPGLGSYPTSELDYNESFAAFLAELEGVAMRHAVESKFGIDLEGRPTIVTLRGQSGTRDGHVHTDSKSKLITMLIYLNEPWEAAGGRLRLLRSPADLENYAVEVPPEGGLMLAFRRSERSYHGHKPFHGPRRVLQLNWVTSRAQVFWDLARHRVSAWLKRAA